MTSYSIFRRVIQPDQELMDNLLNFSGDEVILGYPYGVLVLSNLTYPKLDHRYEIYCIWRDFIEIKNAYFTLNT